MQSEMIQERLMLFRRAQDSHLSGLFSERMEIASDPPLRHSLTEDEQAQLAKAEDSIISATQHKHDLLLLIARNNRLSRCSAGPQARKVFDITELAELIFTHLSIDDLLRMMRVDQTSRNTIQASPVLQRKLHLLPDTIAHLRLLPLRLFTHPRRIPRTQPITIRNGHICLLSAGQSEDPEEAMRRSYSEVTVVFQKPLPRVGDRIRSMLIAQPPVYEMEMRTSCCFTPFTDMDGDEQLPYAVSNHKGVTFGDLHDLAERTMAEHANCPFARPEQHTSDGKVRATVYFRAFARVRLDDPYVVSKFAEYITQVNRRGERGHTPSKLEKFCEKKRIAWAQGLPIPTFEEFSAAAAGTRKTLRVVPSK
ncbi:hypothetical protein LTR56_003382 [Elasticomyces elasticus]|nr:hypothetical protein LTR56_003382 [Elasticomyces elasticus]KAK3664199.1 hypothetical protein LTR22_004897 [Elasticomyces elasticus]KAK4931414.1 hypothetical protein LTR49_002115 [Elasticomyces elasticus]KAK5766065.1 hypothetical protein LTS12_003811 [Elasticomyces elasticus]